MSLPKRSASLIYAFSTKLPRLPLRHATRTMTSSANTKYPRRWSPTNKPTQYYTESGRPVTQEEEDALDAEGLLLQDELEREKEDAAWFVDKDYSLRDTLAKRGQSVLEPKPVPANLPVHLEAFHEELLKSPYFDEVVFIDAKKRDPMAYCSWVVVCQLKPGRERGIRGAALTTKQHVCAQHLSLGIYSMFCAYSQLYRTLRSASPPEIDSSKVLSIEGISEAEPQWALIDATNVIVHVMTAKGRNTWDVEGVWQDRGTAIEEAGDDFSQIFGRPSAAEESTSEE